MRFSLTTMFIAVLWFASLGLIVFYYHPWQRVRLEPFDWPSQIVHNDSFEGRAHAPDERRLVTYDGSTYLLVDGGYAYEFDYWEGNPQTPNRFLDNDTLEMFLAKGNNPFEYYRAIYKRRFPEWWWGHFFRPEVWLFLALTVGLAVRFIMHQRTKRRGD